MRGEAAVLPTEVGALQRLVIQLQEKNKAQLIEQSEKLSILEKQKQILEEELRLLRHKIFGRRSEKYSYENRSLFDEPEWIGEQEDKTLTEHVIEVTGRNRERKRYGKRPKPQ